MKIKKLIAVSITAVLVLISAMIPMSAGAEMTIADNIIDVNFDDGAMTNSAGTTVFNHNHVGAASSSGVFADLISGSNSYKITIPSGASGLSRIGSESWGKTGLSNKAIWYEMSIKFEGAVPTVHVNGIGTIIYIKNDGTLMMPGYISPTTTAPGVTITTDQWYHLVVAIDNIDKWNSAPRNYVWLDGRLIETPRPSAVSSDDWYMSCLGHSTQAADASSNLRIQISAAAAGESTVLFDNIKFYTTSTPVKDADKVLCFDPMAIYDGATVTSDKLRVDETTSTIYAPSSSSMGDVSTMLNSANGLAYYNGGALDDETIVMADAVGGKVFARSTSGVGIKTYTVAEGRRLYDMDSATVAWEKSADGVTYTPVTAASSLAKGDKIRMKVDIINDTTSAENGVLVLAVYNDGKLVNCGLTDYSVAGSNVNHFTSDPVEVSYNDMYYLSHNITVKAYTWVSETDRSPVMASIALN